MSAVSVHAMLDPPRLAAGAAERLQRIGLGALGLGLVAGAIAAIVDPRRFAFAYLVGFAFVATLSLGGLFFVLIQHLTRAGWSVVARRPMEWLASFLPWLAALFVPLALLAPRLYVWMAPGAAHDHHLHAKAAWLNAPFFYVRAVVFLAAWAGLALLFTRASRRQDQTGERALTVKMQAWSAPALVAFALTLTFASFDWLMSLQPLWYSTIFGVYVFAGGFVAALACLALAMVGMQEGGILRTVSTVEHRHDVGKLLFGFTVFWAYIAFSQYFLIWYANIPEETIFYIVRQQGSWTWVSAALPIGAFALPFALLLPRNSKRHPIVLSIAAGLVLVFHYVDLFWLVMPVLDPAGARFGLIELAGLLAPVGLLVFWLARRASRDPLYPLQDPRLGEAVRFENA